MFCEDAGKPDQSMSFKFSGPGNVFLLVLIRKTIISSGWKMLYKKTINLLKKDLSTKFVQFDNEDTRVLSMKTS